MKKSDVPPTKSLSSEACAMKIRGTDSKGQKKSKALSGVLNRKTRSCQKLEISKSNEPSRETSGNSKICLEKKWSLDERLNKYKVEDMTPRELHESLVRIDKNPAQPFTFLSNIFDEKLSDCRVSIERTKPTDIDLQLAALKRRVQMNQSLLERTNEHVKEINFLVEKNSIMASRELNYDSEQRTASGDSVTDGDSALSVACPGIMELQRTIKATNDMLGYVKKICNEEIQMSELPKELTSRMMLDVETKQQKFHD